MDFISIIIYISIYIGLVATSFYILSYRDNIKKERKFFSEEELPKISVLIPAYNEEKSIAQTIESIYKSDYPKEKFEIIVIDDGSKDKTYSIAKKFESEKFPNIKVFHKENGGKGTALNFGISKASGEIIFTMDADTYVNSQSMRKMIHSFTNPRVMAVTAAMLVYKPKTIWQRIQHMEYLLGIFLRKSLATLNAVYITPGAFSAYRLEFFKKYGGYDEKNVTVDIELSLRIQYNGYFIDNCPTAPVWTIAPSTFKGLFMQRRRWYFGFLKNIVKYEKIISKNYGDLGLFVIPVGLIATFLSIFLTIYLFFKSISDISKEFLFYQSVNFDFSNVFHFNYLVFQRFFFDLFTNPVTLFILLFFSMIGFYIYYASKNIGKFTGIIVDLSLFFIFFAFLYGFWWTVSIFYTIFSKKVRWR